MKKIFSILAVLSLLACSEKSNNDYVTIQGTIANADNNTLSILGKDFKKEITLNEDGTYKDTLKVTQGFHGFNDGKQQSFIYLKNGYNLELNFDASNFQESIDFKGEGSITNNYLGKKIQLIKDEQLDRYELLFQMDQAEFDNKVAEIKQKTDDLINQTEGLEKEVVDMETKANKELIDFLVSNYNKEHKALASIKKGAPSPTFNYPDNNGNSVSLEDLKGKYVYIDVWATWCGPCKVEIPYLKEIDDEFKGKDIAFVSLSIDKMERKEKWLKMIQEEKLQGIQVLADKDWNSDFVTAFNIKGIPRFILLDKNGNIVDANAPRPSDPNLKGLLNSLEL